MTIEVLTEKGLLREEKREKESRYLNEKSGMWRLNVQVRNFLNKITIAASVYRTTAHVVIAGLPRSGSTLLQIMMRSCIEDSWVPEDEVPALHLAQKNLGRRRIIVSKRPNDLFWYDEIREFYENRERICPIFIVTIRDPRDIIVSTHGKRAGDYYVDIPRVREFFSVLQYLQRQNTEEIFLLDYEFLVEFPDEAGKRIAELLQVSLRLPFSKYHEGIESQIEPSAQLALNGLRPVERSSVSRWKRKEHMERIRAAIREWPELAEVVRRYGWEADDSWVSRFC